MHVRLPRARTWTFIAALVALPLLLPACSSPPPPPPSPAQRELDQVRVEPPHDLRGFSPDQFGRGWALQPMAGPGCTTKDTVLLLRAQNAHYGPGCTPSGTWTTATGVTTTNPADLDIDHTVSLANAWASGADAWTPQQRSAFANDLASPELAPESRDLVAQHAATPGPWTPPMPQTQCGYAHAVITIKRAYRLAVTPQEKQSLAQMLHRCPTEPGPGH